MDAVHGTEPGGTIHISWDVEGCVITIDGWVPTPAMLAEMLMEIMQAYAKAAAHGRE